ncbi:MAG TPA: hypothetical protein PKE25_00155 [Novosphingobium sp.]|nr:hypothetical protein [Novosphingobium sp.]
MSRAASSLFLLTLAACAAPGLSRLEATLASHDSATLALENWCQARGLADPPAIRAEPEAGAAAAPPADLASLLALSADEAPAYRRVALTCGDAVLSRAHNWYVPARLTPAMNAELAMSTTPFGKVAAPLGFRRERLDSQRGAAPGCPAGTLLSHRARLILPDGRPLALLVECYTPANLAGSTARP